MTDRARRVPAVIAAVLAMLASVMALAAIVVSDIAEAGERGVSESDEPIAAPPVLMKKVQVKTESPELDHYEDLEVKEPVKRKPSKKGLRFGRFEGY